MSHSSEYPTPHPSQPQPGGPYYQQPSPKKETNILGLISLIAGVLGFIFACIPGILIVGWVLLPIAFILGIISLFLHGKSKWMGLVGLILSVVGTIVGVCVFIFVVGSAINDAGNISAGDPTPESSTSSSKSKAQDSPHFGQKYTWDNGLAITVGEPTGFTPSETAYLDDSHGEVPRKFTVTIHNGTDKPVDASMISMQVQSGGRQAGFASDSEQNVTGGGQGKIQPGKDLTYDIGFTVMDPNSISMDVSSYDDETFDSYEVTFLS
ncbi:DUF308 domain-containing protein [Curtobacterium sp. S6]|uniref:DUF308 domain-containing protein n=1 Tax=Curtobacterium sp. S6 TaxID=1479623 RepID=UPI00068FCBA9|nr:DUF308 domain-containing protein [Curtobacterium sp. S6]